VPREVRHLFLSLHDDPPAQDRAGGRNGECHGGSLGTQDAASDLVMKRREPWTRG
jgi:hypothetical protein